MGYRQPWRIAAAVFLIASANAAIAQAFPNRPVRFIVPSQPGGVVDITTRVLAPRLGEIWKQSTLVENRPGGNGLIGLDAAAKATPDGHTLLVGIGSDFSITPHFYPKHPGDPLRDFAPVTLVTDNPLMFAAPASAPFNSVAEMITYAKTQAGGLAFASPGAGSHNQLIGERFAIDAGIKLLHIPYKGGGPAGAALASGEVPLAILAAASAVPHIKTGRAKAIAVTSTRRLAVGPDWPTLAESGLPGFDASNWVAIAAPAAVPKEIIARVHADVVRALAATDVRERLAAAGSEIVGSTPDALAARMRADSERYAALIARLGIKLD